MGTTRKLLLSCLVLGVVGAAAGFSTFSAFSGTTTNSGNTFATGTVTISDNDAGGALYNVPNALPGVNTASHTTSPVSRRASKYSHGSTFAV